MAKLALINKQNKREKLVAQYAKKRETIKAKMSVNATPEERIDAMKKWQNCHVMQTQLVCVIVAVLPVVHAVFPVCSVCAVSNCVQWQVKVNCQAYVNPAGKKRTQLWTMQL